MDPNQAKKELRQQVNQRIAALTRAYCKQADEAICGHIIGLPQYRQAEAIFCFVGMDTEIDTTAVLHHALAGGKRLGVPRCVSKGEMEVFEIHSLEDLEAGQYGILEPKQSCPKIDPNEIQFGVIPCVASDRFGHRLGHGGGYYDRYLEHTTFPTAVICREQILCDSIPKMEHDVDIDFVITEDGVFQNPEKQ